MYSDMGYLGTFISMIGTLFYKATFRAKQYSLTKQYFYKGHGMDEEEILVHDMLSVLFRDIVALDGGIVDAKLNIPITEIPGLLMPVKDLQNAESKNWK